MIKKSLFIFLGLLLSINIFAATKIPITNKSENVAKLDVLSVMKYAYDNNRDLKILNAHIKYSKRALESAYRKFGFNLGVAVAGYRENKPSFYFGKTVDERNLNMMGVDFNNPGVNSHYETTFNFGIPLYYKGLKKLTREFAELDSEISSKKFDAAANKIVSSAISLYYNFRLALDGVALSEKALKRAKLQYKNVKIMYDGGSVLKTDLLSMQVRVEESRLNLVKAKNGLAVVRSMLLNFIGLPESSKIIPVDKELNISILPKTYDEAIKLAFLQRDELKVARLMLKQGKLGVKMAKSAKKPEVMLFGNWAYNDDNLTLSSKQDNYFIGAKVSLNILDNGVSAAETRVADAQYEEGLRKYEKAQKDIELDVRTAYENLSGAKEALKVSRANLKSARENLQLMKQYYKGGSSTITAYLNTDTALSGAELHEASAKYNLLSSEAELSRAVGYCILCIRKSK